MFYRTIINTMAVTIFSTCLFTNARDVFFTISVFYVFQVQLPLENGNTVNVIPQQGEILGH